MVVRAPNPNANPSPNSKLLAHCIPDPDPNPDPDPDPDPGALRAFTAPEQLCGDNCYACPRCEAPTRASKLLSVHHAPHVLVLQLKRFAPGRANSKIRRPVAYAEHLDLAPYSTCGAEAAAASAAVASASADTAAAAKAKAKAGGRGEEAAYELYAVLVHQGASVHSGHYYAYVKPASGVWYMLDDDEVTLSLTLSLGRTLARARARARARALTLIRCGRWRRSAC